MPGHPNQHKINHTQAARDILSGKGITASLKAAGYSEETANQGLSSNLWDSAPMREAFITEAAKWEAVSKYLPSATARAAIARTRLLINVIQGKDRGVQSVKLLGQDREVNMFEPEVAVGIQVAVNPPSSIKTEFLEAEDPIKPDK